MQEVLCQGEGKICNIKWRGRFAAFVTDKGVRVYDVVEMKMISLIQRPVSCPPNLACPWRIGWSDQFHLDVSFGDCVKSCVVKKRAARSDQMPVFCVEVTHHFSLGCWVSGLAKLDNLLVLLAIPKVRYKKGFSGKERLTQNKLGQQALGWKPVSIIYYISIKQPTLNKEYTVGSVNWVLNY